MLKFPGRKTNEPQAMTIKDVPIRDIQIGPRFRQDTGDVESLADNIREIGLLEPIGIDESYKLIFGARRFIACAEILKWEIIPCVVLKLNSLLTGEYSENEFRKQFTPSERRAIGEAIERELGNRQGQRTDKRESNQLVENFPQVEKGEKTRDIAARIAGFGNARTYEQAKQVINNGSRELITAMDTKEVSIHAAAKIATQPKADQVRILSMPKDERRTVVRKIRETKADHEADERRARDLLLFGGLYDAVQLISRFHENPHQAWEGLWRVSAFDFPDLLPRAIQCLCRLEKEMPNGRKPEIVHKKAK